MSKRARLFDAPRASLEVFAQQECGAHVRGNLPRSPPTPAAVAPQSLAHQQAVLAAFANFLLFVHTSWSFPLLLEEVVTHNVGAFG